MAGTKKKKTPGTRKSAARRKKAAAAPEKPRRSRLLRRKEPDLASAPRVEARAQARYVRVSPQKARLVIDLIRGQAAGQALWLLQFTKKRVAKDIEKVLRSAIANAEQKSEAVDVDRLYVKYAVVNEGSRWKRLRPAPMGRAFVYQRRTSHIEIAVAERAAAAGAVSPAAAEAS